MGNGDLACAQEMPCFTCFLLMLLILRLLGRQQPWRGGGFLEDVEGGEGGRPRFQCSAVLADTARPRVLLEDARLALFFLLFRALSFSLSD